jgi:hypothetical protein
VQRRDRFTGARFDGGGALRIALAQRLQPFAQAPRVEPVDRERADAAFAAAGAADQLIARLARRLRDRGVHRAGEVAVGPLEVAPLQRLVRFG